MNGPTRWPAYKVRQGSPAKAPIQTCKMSGIVACALWRPPNAGVCSRCSCALAVDSNRLNSGCVVHEIPYSFCLPRVGHHLLAVTQANCMRELRSLCCCATGSGVCRSSCCTIFASNTVCSAAASAMHLSLSQRPASKCRRQRFGDNSCSIRQMLHARKEGARRQ